MTSKNMPGTRGTGTSVLVEKIGAFVRKHALLQGGETVLVGLSGGPDSVCLLSLLCRLKDEFGLTLHAVYVNHNLRTDEIPREIAFCRDLCGKLGVHFSVSSVDVKSHAETGRLGKQEAARELRYGAFRETALSINADRIALGHNADDQAETFVMRLLRGSGPRGLAGIPVRRDRIIRPMMEIGREEIEQYLQSEDLSWVIDSSNLETEYLRNSIRKDLMPFLKKLNPNLNDTLARTMSVLREEERYFDIVVTKALMKTISRKHASRIELFLSPLENLDVVILRRVLRRAIDATEGLGGIGFVHIEGIIGLIRDGRPGDRVYLPHGIRVIRDYSLLVLTSEAPVKLSEYEISPPGEIAVREAGAVIRASFPAEGGGRGDGRSAAVLDAGGMKFPLTVRPRAAGDFFFPLGFEGRKKLQDFFVDEKVPREERDRVPIVVSGDDIIWVAGYRADNRFRVTDSTEKLLRLEILKANL